MQHVPPGRIVPAAPPRHVRLFELIRQENLAGRDFRPRRRDDLHPILCAQFKSLAQKSLRPGLPV